MNAFGHRRSTRRLATMLAVPGAAALLGGCGPGPLAPIGPVLGPLFGPGSEWLGGLLMLPLIAVVAIALDRRRRRRSVPPTHVPDDKAPAVTDAPSTPTSGPSGEIKDIVLKRYARGEIDRDAFLQMWNDLNR